jgi:hypothetical protein
MCVFPVKRGLVEVNPLHWQNFLSTPNRMGRLWQGSSRQSPALYPVVATVAADLSGLREQLNVEFRRLQVLLAA